MRCRRFCSVFVRQLPTLLVMSVIISLLLFFLFDTPTHHRSTSQTHDVTDTTTQRRDVLLLSLARSGSSFTADVISHAPNVYYVFEPLRQAEKAMRKLFDSTSLEDRVTFMHQWQEVYRDVLRHFLSCDFTDLDLSLLDATYLERMSRTKALARCVRQLTNATESPPDPDCVRVAAQQCSNANLTLLKVIRLRVRDVEPLLTNHSNLVVLLLVRDPRASLYSRKNVFHESMFRELSKFAHTQCNILNDDVTTALELRQRFPDRVRLIHYESLAEDPVRVSKALYRFLGLPWSNRTERAIQRQTSSSHLPADSKARPRDRHLYEYSVVRNDSALTARAWREKIDWHFAWTVQQVCFAVMRQLGYVLFRFWEDLQDLALPSYTDDLLLLQDPEALLP